MATAETEPSTAAVPADSSSSSRPHFLLYNYWRSGASWRVRIALHYKQLPFTSQPVNLLKAEQQSESYHRINASAAVPALVVSYSETQQQIVIAQSNAIMEWLEDTHKELPLLPAQPSQPQHHSAFLSAVRRTIVVADTHPVANLRVLQRLQELTGGEEQHKQEWAAHWITAGLKAFEAVVSFCAGRYCYGDEISLADCVLVPQLFSARRYNVDLSPFPVCLRIESALAQHPAFIAAHADNQADKPS